MEMRAAPEPADRPMEVGDRLRGQISQMTSRMESAILTEVPHYRAVPERYRTAVRQRCRLAVRIFRRILETNRPPSEREFAVVRNVGLHLALDNEPLEPLLHALRIGARVGWEETLRLSLDDPEVPREQMLVLAGQVFEYIDQLSSSIAQAYSDAVEQAVRAQALGESALFEDLISGRAGPDRLEAAGRDHARVAVALAAVGPDRAAAAQSADVIAARLRMRFPRSVGGTRHGVPVWLMAREPLAQALEDCRAGQPASFGVSTADGAVTLGRAVEEAVVAARLALELGLVEGTAVEYPRVYTYAALRTDPVGLARSQAVLLGPLLSKPALLHTLREYFGAGRSMSATATRIHLHRQSVIYRMARVCELLGVSLDDAEVMFRLEAAVRTMGGFPEAGLA